MGTLVPAYADPALIQTFLQYDYVLWYTDQQPSLGVAQLTLFPYMQNGGRVIFSTSFINTIDPLGGYASFSVGAWMPVGITGIIRGAARNATITAQTPVTLLMIPREVYLNEWHRTYAPEELRDLLCRNCDP